MILKRKIYDKLLAWKKGNGRRAMLIEGARRVGKSTIAEEFGKNEYRSYILIDFAETNSTVKNAFENSLDDLDSLFLILSTIYGTKLYKRESLIIFDEVQKFPRAREAIKYLVKDGRYDYLETGSLISIRENVSKIIIPSEESSVHMYPLDFEEFLWAMGEDMLWEYIKKCYLHLEPLSRDLHAKAMLLLRQYMLIGGMPMSVIAYLENNKDFEASDSEKRDIIRLYRSDIHKITDRYRDKVMLIYDRIPSLLSRHEKRIVFSQLKKGTSYEDYERSLFWLDDSMMANICYAVTDPNVGLPLSEDSSSLKCYQSDTGLLISQAFGENEIRDNELYKAILLDKLSLNEGMFFENLVAQMLVANNHKLYFYSHYNMESHRQDIEIDFLITSSNSLNYKVFPIEVKSTDKYRYVSLSRFVDKFGKRIGKSYVIHPRNLAIKDDGVVCLPIYMTPLL